MLKKIELQEQIEKTWDKSQFFDEWAEYLISLDLPKYLEEQELDLDFSMSALTLLAMKQVLEPSALIGMMRKYREDIQEVADELAKLVLAEFIIYDEVEDKLISTVEPSEYLKQIQRDYQFLPPMIVEPEEVKDNNSIGYRTYKRTPLMGGCYHKEDISLDVLNKINKNRYSINEVIYNQCDNKFKNENNKNIKTKRLFNERLSRVVDLMLKTGNSFHFCWLIDYRGRVYPHADTLTAQGNDYGKAILEWEEAQPVDLDAIQ